MVPVGLVGLLRVTATGLLARISKLFLVLTMHRTGRGRFVLLFNTFVSKLIKHFPLYVLKLSVIGSRATSAALRCLMLVD